MLTEGLFVAVLLLSAEFLLAKIFNLREGMAGFYEDLGAFLTAILLVGFLNLASQVSHDFLLEGVETVLTGPLASYFHRSFNFLYLIETVSQFSMRPIVELIAGGQMIFYMATSFAPMGSVALLLEAFNHFFNATTNLYLFFAFLKLFFEEYWANFLDLAGGIGLVLYVLRPTREFGASLLSLTLGFGLVFPLLFGLYLQESISLGLYPSLPAQDFSEGRLEEVLPPWGNMDARLCRNSVIASIRGIGPTLANPSSEEGRLLWFNLQIGTFSIVALILGLIGGVLDVLLPGIGTKLESLVLIGSAAYVSLLGLKGYAYFYQILQGRGLMVKDFVMETASTSLPMLLGLVTASFGAFLGMVVGISSSLSLKEHLSGVPAIIGIERLV